VPTLDTAPAWEAWLIALLVYPGGLFALALAAGVELARGIVTGALAPPGGRVPRASLAGQGAALRRWATTRRPARGSPSAWGGTGQAALALAGIVAPLAALALLPLPGHPLMAAQGVPPIGDGLAIWALLLTGPLAHAALGLGTAEPGAQLAGARRLQTAILGSVPATLALAALATAAGSLRLDLINARLVAPGVLPLSLALGLAAAAVLVCLPALAGWPPADVAGVRPGPAASESILAGLPARLPALVWAGAVLGRAAWAATLVLLGVPGAAATPAGPGDALLFAGALAALVIGLAAWGARRIPPRPDQITGLTWLLALPLAAAALALVLIF
jgi:formate hydrogenlyase subunit 4